MKQTKPLRITAYAVPAPCEPRRLALVADLHDGDPARLCAALTEARPDAILLAGDLYEGPPRRRAFSVEHAAAFLRFCGGLAPAFYARGNHDVSPHPDVDAALSESGVTLLDDRAVDFFDVRIGGLTSGHYRPDRTPDLGFARAFAAERGVKILICHHPEYYRRYLRGLDFDLIVSGHDHGGQWAVAGHGLYVPGQGLFPPHTSGLVDGRMVVSRGVFNNVPVPRIGAPTELVVIRFGRPADGSAKEEKNT